MAAVRRRPRHLVLGALVAGLLVHGRPGAALALAALFAVAAGRPPVALACAAATLGGAAVADARLAAIDRSELTPHLGRELTVRAEVLEPPRQRRSGGHAALARLLSPPDSGERVVLLTPAGRRRLPAEIGTIVAARGTLLPLGLGESHQRRRGAHGVLVAESIVATGARRGGLAGAFDRLRAAADRSVTAGLRPPLAALALGMVLGRDERLPEPTREDFRRSGLAHLLAASGQNVVLLAALALPLLAAVGLGLRGRLAGALALTAVYVPLAGAAPSIQRAGVMGGAAIVAGLAGRPASRWYALLLAAAVTLLVNPRAAGDPGWQLSFAAVAGIALLAARWRDGLVRRRVPRGLADAAAITTAAGLATAPLLAFHFGRVSLVSLPANLLAAVAVAPVMWLGMLATVTGLIVPQAAAVLNGVAQFPLAYLAWLARAAARVPGSTASIAIGSTGALVAVYAGVAGLVALSSRRAGRRAVSVALAAVAVAAAAAGYGAVPSPPDHRDLVVSFLDVGQGDATLIQHGGATVLVDTGPANGPLLRRLGEAGVRRVDLLIVTHAQADHEGRAAAVIRRYPVGVLLDGGDGAGTREHGEIVAAARLRRVSRVAPDAGQVLKAGPIVVEVLWPDREPAEWHAGEDPNRRAIVARVRVGDFDLLLPADAESDVTAGLALPRVEALKVAHHGSADPQLPDALERLAPRVAVIEVGRGNRYGHPTAQTLAALRAVPSVYRTDRDGTVRLTVRGGRMTVATDP